MYIKNIADLNTDTSVITLNVNKYSNWKTKYQTGLKKASYERILQSKKKEKYVSYK